MITEQVARHEPKLKAHLLEDYGNYVILTPSREGRAYLCTGFLNAFLYRDGHPLQQLLQLQLLFLPQEANRSRKSQVAKETTMQ